MFVGRLRITTDVHQREGDVAAVGGAAFVLEANGQFAPAEGTAADLVVAVLKNPELADRIVLTSYALPLGDAKEPVLAQKVALREVNAHSIVNATTRFAFGKKVTVDSVALVFGGIAPYPWHAAKTESARESNEGSA